MEVEQMFVTPAKGLKVRDPRNHQVLPAGGAVVPLDQFWRRRLADGDVNESKPPSEPVRTPARGSRE